MVADADADSADPRGGQGATIGSPLRDQDLEIQMVSPPRSDPAVSSIRELQEGLLLAR